MSPESFESRPLSRNLIEAMSWTLVSEFLRRYPGTFSVFETHPGGGMYDCLSLYQSGVHLCDFNRNGSIHLWANTQGSGPSKSIPDPWRLMLKQDSPRDLLNWICAGLQLEVPKKLPAADAPTILFRVVAAFLRMNAFDLHEWRVVNGVLDTSDFGGGCRSDVDAIPGLRERMRIAPAPRGHTDPSYSFWFLRRDEEPLVGFEINGTAWGRTGATLNLVQRYRTTRSLAAVVSDIVDLFPPD